jgi:hypothetical protein
MEDVYRFYSEPSQEDSAAQWRVNPGGMANKAVEAMGDGGSGVRVR